MAKTIADGTIRVESHDEGAFWHIILNKAPTNIIDMEMMQALIDTFKRARAEKQLRSVLITGAGDHFSYGTSVQEQLPDLVGKMIPLYHKLFRTMLDASLFLIAAVRGQCLGGGLELATICNRVYASPDARLGQPEIKLGLFPPVASLILSERIGRAAAFELCASAHIKSAEEASWIGLVDHVVDDPEAVAMGEIREFLLPLSASSVRFSIRALNMDFRRRFLAGLEEMESLYLNELMSTKDANEGVRASLDQREPQWSHE